MFRVGQRVRLNEYAKKHIFYSRIIKDNVFTVVGQNGPFLVMLTKYKQNNAGEDVVVQALPQELAFANPTCPVCNQEIETEDNKIKEHNYNSEICYGSYIPIVL